jgi:hypothetical protein
VMRALRPETSKRLAALKVCGVVVLIARCPPGTA